MSPEAVGTLLASPVLGAAAAKLWQWWTERDKAQRDAAAARDAATVARNASERTDVIALLREQTAAGEQRAERSAARADAMVEALHAVTEQVRALGDAVDDLRAAVTAHATREGSEIAAIGGRLSVLLPAAPTTGEQPRASIVPDMPRLPSPSALRPVTPPPPRRQS